MNEKQWRAAKNILCVRLDNLGDVLMTTPAMRALKLSEPDRRIVLLASHAGAAAARFIPEVDEVIEYQSPWMKSTKRHDATLDHAIVRALRRHKFDAAVIFTVYSQSPLPAALLCYFAEIPLRLAHCRENPYQLLSDWIADPEPENVVRHEVRRQLDLVAAIGSVTVDERLSFAVSFADLTWARERLQAIGVDITRRWFLLHPGASAASRCYPPELWAEAARQITIEADCPVVLTGSANEAPLVENIRCLIGTRAHSLVGQLELGQFAAVVSLAPLLLCGNTGPVHVAAAVGTPVVDLYALTNPQHTPWQVPNRVLFHDVPCRFCYKSVCPKGHNDCLRKITPAQIVEASMWLLDQGRSRSGDGREFVLPYKASVQVKVDIHSLSR
ncbi:MAG: glycosyltransferase family 9 protein [Pseudomonadota bacterium]